MNTAFKCSGCGAITVQFESGAVNSMRPKDFKDKVKGLKLASQKVYNCDYCINKWGIDLCGCGSGEKVGKCTNTYHECINHIPAQELEVKRQFVGWGH